MPKIINAYSGNESIAENLKGLGEAMFGDGAKNEVLRETAAKYHRENEAANALPDLYRSGDLAGIGGQILRHNPNASNIGGVNLARTGLGPDGKMRTDYEAPDLATAALAGGHPAEGTMPGLQQTIGQRAAAAHEATQRAAETQAAIEERKLNFAARYPSKDIVEGRALSDALGYGRPQAPAPQAPRPMQPGAGEGFVNPSSVNGQKQNLTGDIIPPGGTGAMPAAQPAPQPTAPQQQPGSPPGYIHPKVQALLNYPHGAAPYQHLATGAVGQSYDGGKTIDGHPAGEGWVAVTPQEAINRTRENQQVEQAHRPLPPAQTQAYPQAAVDAAATSGIKAAVQHEANNMWGSLGGGEVGANTNRARENLGLLASQARTVLATTPGHQSNQAQRWADELVPHPGWLGVTAANPDEAKNRVMSLIAHMRQLHELEGQEAAQTADPALRNALLAHRTRLEQTISLYEKGTAPAAPNLGPKPVQTQTVRAPAAQPVDEASLGLFPEPTGEAPQAPAQQPAAPVDHVIDPKTGQQLKWTGYIWTPVQ